MQLMIYYLHPSGWLNVDFMITLFMNHKKNLMSGFKPIILLKIISYFNLIV